VLVYINEVLHYEFVHRKISTLTFETHHVYAQANVTRKYVISSWAMCPAHTLSKFITKTYL